MIEKSRPSRRKSLIALLVLVPVLFLLAWSQASLRLPIRPSSPQETLLLLFLSATIFVAFVIFALILLRILLKLYVERKQEQLGSRFKTKMVVAFLGLSLVPVCFLFAFAHGLLNRSIDKWFGIPFDTVRKDTSEIVRQLELEAEQRALRISTRLATRKELVHALTRNDVAALDSLLSREITGLGFESAMCFDSQGHALAYGGEKWLGAPEITHLIPAVASGSVPTRGALARWRRVNDELFLAARPVNTAEGKLVGVVVSATRLPLNIKQTAEEIQREAQTYERLSREMKTVKGTYLSILGLLTLLILFIAAWFAMFFSKQVTLPVQALAEATHEVSKGNLGFQITARADDELGTLIHSFNEMTRQLQENREAIEQASRELQQANSQLEERGNTMEAILESIPTGVISLDPNKQITGVNSTVARMFAGRDAQSARKLPDLFSPEDAREISRLFRRAARQGVVTRQMEREMGGRRTSVALTISSIRARRGTVGSVLVLEDLADLLRAQKAAAWQEVAQRIAHEIKNPLTPIQLSTERIRRLIAKAAPNSAPQELLNAVAESASLIGREVTTLKRLVNEFSSFTRFPVSRLVRANLNAIIEKALNVFDGRLDGIQVHRDLSRDLPPVQADPEQMKRAVVNLVDNAAEALEKSLQKEIWVRTGLEAERDVAELVIADSGPGFPPEAKERLFLPYFSTKRGGTGLGLAIVSRIVSDHKGTIRVEENQPTGTKFIIEIPIERAAAANPES
jgi:PAS domain S-box-containing protein